ncbi:response regulator [Fredinandcohnia humi]
MQTIKVLIIEDQEIVREGLQILLNLQNKIEVIGTADNGKNGIVLCEQLKPDVILMDINMPVMNGVLATQIIKERWPDIKVIILTTYQEINYVVDALSVGAEGFLLKAIKPSDLADGIRLICNGGTLIPPHAAQAIIKEYKELKNINIEKVGISKETKLIEKSFINKFSLTERESQVLQLIAEGYSNFKISQTLFLSEGTVKNYISSIYSKLEISNRKEVVKFIHQERKTVL